MRNNIIYSLSDPRTGEIRYVGKSVSGLQRPKSHLYQSNRIRLARLPVYNWINILFSQNLKPNIDIIEDEISTELLSCTEMYYIKEFKNEGNRLLNCTSGGEGTLGRKVSKKTKEKLKKLYRGRRLSETTKIKISNSHKGKKLSKEHKIKIEKSSPFKKAVLCVELNLSFDSVREAARYIKRDHKGIIRVLNGKQKTCGSYTWKHIPSAL